MASIKGQRSQGNQGKYMSVNGGSVVDVDRISGSLYMADTWDILIPAGAQITGIEWQINLSNAFTIGYRAKDPSSTLPASTNYFSNGATQTASAGIRNMCSFTPIKFEEDIYIQFNQQVANYTGPINLDVMTTYNCVGPS